MIWAEARDQPLPAAAADPLNQREREGGNRGRLGELEQEQASKHACMCGFVFFVFVCVWKMNKKIAKDAFLK